MLRVSSKAIFALGLFGFSFAHGIKFSPSLEIVMKLANLINSKHHWDRNTLVLGKDASSLLSVFPSGIVASPGGSDQGRESSYAGHLNLSVFDDGKGSFDSVGSQEILLILNFADFDKTRSFVGDFFLQLQSSSINPGCTADQFIMTIELFWIYLIVKIWQQTETYVFPRNVIGEFVVYVNRTYQGFLINNKLERLWDAAVLSAVPAAFSAS